MIFKTINSSVDNTRKTLSLFNKDWNTYKTNWQQGFSQNGISGGIKSIFQSSNSVISKDQLQILRNWNNAVAHGCTKQETFNRIIKDADSNTKLYFSGLNKGKGSVEGLKNAQNFAKQSTIGLTIAQTALNAAISLGITAAIMLAIKGFDKLANSAKRASEAADEAFSDTTEKVQKNEEEAKSLDELISKYKELKTSENLDVDGRKEIKEIQNDIADLVGVQASNLDLVNGKLDDEISKLDEISEKEAKNAYETATANYNNSKKASEKATGDDSFLFFDGIAYTGKREKEAEKILQNAGFNNVQAGGFFGNTLFVRDEFDNDHNELKGAQEKADYLQSMIDILEQNGQRATDLYAGLISQRDKYLQYIDNQQDAANSLVNSWISYSQFSNDELSKINVDSLDSFEEYRQKMIEEAKNDESIGKMLADGTLSDEDLENAVNDFMATSTKFSTWYEQWIGNIESDVQHETPTSFKQAWAGLDNNEDYKNTKKEVLELAEAGKLTVSAFEKADDGNAKKYFKGMGIGAEEATKKINTTVDAVKQLSSLKSGITSIRDAYTEKKDDGIVGADTLDSMEKEFGNLGKAWKNYKKIAGSSKSKLSDLADAEDKLAKAYLQSNNFLANLTDENGNYDESIRQLYIDQLKSYGIKNAENVVDSEIARQRGDATAAYAALSNQQKKNIKSVAELKDKTSDEILELYNEADGSDTAKQALLRLSMVNTNWEDLDTTETCNQLMNIARAAGIATDQILGLNGLKIKSVSDYSTTTSPGLQTNSGLFNTNQNPSSTNNSFQPNNIPGFKQFVINNTYKTLNGSTQDYTKPDLKHGSDKNKNKNTKGGGNNSKSSDSKTQFDWIERRITNLQTRFDRWKTIIENSSLKFIDKYYKKATSYAKKLVNTEGSAYTKYLKKANGVTISKNSKTDKSFKAKVRNGKISGKTSDLIKEYGSKTADKIQKYQDYYEKATSALDSFVEKAQELYNLPLDKAAGKIEKFSDAIDLLEKKLDNAITATAKNKIIDDEVKQKKKTYDANKSANNKAQKNLKSAGKTLKKSVGKRQKKSTTKAVKNGKEVDLAKFKEGSKAYKAAVKYNAALNAKTKAQQEKDVSEQEYNYYKDIEAPKTKFDNVKDEYENKLTVIDTRIQNLDNQIDNIEASGATVDNSFYREKKKQTDQKKALLIEEKNRLTESLKGIKKYSAEWYTANDEINKVNDSIAECTKTQYELNDAIAEGNKKIFEKKLEGYQRIIDEQDFLLGLIEHEDSVDSDTGVRTDAGNARLHSYTADYYASDEKVNIATAERQRLENMKATKEYGVGYEYSSLEALNNAINDIIKIQQENIASKYSIEKKIVDEVTKSYQAQMTVLQKLIDKKKEQLETEKD